MAYIFKNQILLNEAKDELMNQLMEMSIKKLKNKVISFSKPLTEKIALMIISIIENYGFTIDRLGLTDENLCAYISIIS